MGEIIASGPVLSDSLFKTRPSFRTYFRSDANALGNSVTQNEQARLKRQMKFPSTAGRGDVDSFRDPQNPRNAAFTKYSDEGRFRPSAPYRSCDNSIDPVAGFVSICGDIDRHTGHDNIRSLVQLEHTPHSSTPQQRHSIRVDHPAAPPETRRLRESDPGTPYEWNSKKVHDASTRAQLGGWTSAKDPRKEVENRLRGVAKKTPADEAKELRDKLAARYMYTSSTQRSYEEVPWDNILAPRQWAPTSTLEQKPDMISQRWTIKRNPPQAEEWQNIGRSWDWFQKRENNYKNGPMDIVFCGPCPRAQHIPLYSGTVGGVNNLEIDNMKVPFVPHTIKRVPIPRPTETSHRPHIPGYAGSTLYRSVTAPVILQTGQAADPNSSTHNTHKPIPVPDQPMELKHKNHLSKMVTTVPPCNPFNKVTWPEVKAIN